MRKEAIHVLGTGSYLHHSFRKGEEKEKTLPRKGVFL
jgi:hypothetical protein